MLAGYNAVTVDIVGATMIGFDINKIPLIRKTLDGRKDPLPLYNGTTNDIIVVDSESEYSVDELKKLHNRRFEALPA